MDLTGALGLDDREVVSFVGAGGKKTAMARLVEEGIARGRAVGYTTTAHVPPPEYPLVLAAPDSLLETLAETDPEATDGPDGDAAAVAFARERVANPDRVDEKLRGFPPSVVDDVFEAGGFDWLLVKADGARMRELKAPGADEPPVPSRSTVVAPVVSVRAVGSPLTAEVAHRPERIAAVTGRTIGAELAPTDVGTLLASPDGGLKRVPGASTVVPIVNKADTRRLRERGRAVLAAAFERTERFDRGLVTSLERGDCEVVRASDVT